MSSYAELLSWAVCRANIERCAETALTDSPLAALGPTSPALNQPRLRTDQTACPDSFHQGRY
jgi:hypothetical protein